MVSIFFVILIHFAPKVVRKLNKKQKNNSSKWIAKLKDIVKKIVDNVISKLRGGAGGYIENVTQL